MKKVFFLFTIVLLFIALPATVYLAGQQQELRKRAAPATTLSFTPSDITQKVNDVFSVEVTIDTGANQVILSELHVVYDPAILEAESISNSSLFPNVLTAGVVDRGTATITVGAADTKKPIQGTGTVAVIRLKAIGKTDTPSSVRLEQNTFVGGVGEGSTNILVGSTPAKITVTDDSLATNVTPYPTPTGTATPIPTPTVKPVDSPVSTLSSAPTATLSGVNATSSGVIQIISPAINSSTTISTPTIRGKAQPGATITITVYSTPQTYVVTADKNGNWSYTPTAPLASGQHNVVASTVDTGGTTHTSTTAFLVAGAGDNAATMSATVIPTAQPIPTSGNTSPTTLLISIGAILLLFGFAYPLIPNK